MTQLKRAVIYARVSTDGQSCERQIKDLNEFAQRAGYEIVATHTETASGMKDNRPERAKIIQLAQARKIDVVLVTEMTRWGRSTVDLLGTLKTLFAQGVSVIAPTGLSYDLSTPQGELMATIVAGLAKYERDLLAERTKSGLAAARARGKKLGRQEGDCPSDKYAKKVLKHLEDGRSVRWIAHEMQIAPNTIQAIKRRHSAA